MGLVTDAVALRQAEGVPIVGLDIAGACVCACEYGVHVCVVWGACVCVCGVVCMCVYGVVCMWV